MCARGVALCLLLTTGATHLRAASPAREKQPVRIHENMRQTPYPHAGSALFLNPAPLLVPEKMKQSDLLQFQLSRQKDFSGTETILSKPVPWCMFNPHQVLAEGTWYWRFRSISRSGQEMPWSKSLQFTMTDDVPRFVTPSFEVLLKGIPQQSPRLFCFLDEGLSEARRTMRSHPEFNRMITDARTALAVDHATDTLPYKHATALSMHCENLFTAYQLTQRTIYKEKMVQIIRWLLPATVTDEALSNDFYAGDLAALLACTYETCYDRFAPSERKQMEQLMLRIVTHYYHSRIIGYTENHIFENHFWQFTFRKLLQASLVLYDRYPEAREYLEYSYELWTARAPATGFNRDGAWANGTCYFSANAVSLWYVPSLFSHLTGSDFLQHPWYREAGKALAFSWPPHSASVGFGDGNEQMNDKPLIIRSAFAEFLARETGSSYAAWYASADRRYEQDAEMRLYRMVQAHRPKAASQLPADAPKAAWFRDCGEMIANSRMDDYRNNLCLSFRSSPFGSGSHTHSNQNAFNLHFRGVPVYHSTGYYTNFKDAHNLLSYRHTRAHNTLLVDGIGQPFSLEASGNIVRMLGGKHISYSLGDASHAYYGISDSPMWIKNFADQNVEQSVANGFGPTPLKLYRRHLFLLHPDKVLIYDEMEASKAVRWDWLLHSPVEFFIDKQLNRLTTRNKEKGFVSVAQLFSEQSCALSQTDQFVSPPQAEKAVRGEAFDNQWHFTASFGPSKANRILTIIQVQPEGTQVAEVLRSGNRFACGDWTIEAELNPGKPAGLCIRHAVHQSVFSYGSKHPTIDGKKYVRSTPGSSLLYDEVGGEWQVQEMSDIL